MPPVFSDFHTFRSVEGGGGGEETNKERVKEERKEKGIGGRLESSNERKA